jgi:hypothetical protein
LCKRRTGGGREEGISKSRNLEKAIIFVHRKIYFSKQIICVKMGVEICLKVEILGLSQLI